MKLLAQRAAQQIHQPSCKANSSKPTERQRSRETFVPKFGLSTMKSFGFDEALNGTRCSQNKSLAAGTYNTGLKARGKVIAKVSAGNGNFADRFA